MYIYKTQFNTYKISKRSKDGNGYDYYGSYKTKEEAEAKLQQLIDDGTIIPRIKTLPKYIHHTHAGYLIYKKRDGKQVYYGHFDTLEEAIVEVEKLKANNWESTRQIRRKRKVGKEWKYIYKNKTGRYSIRRRGESYGTYKTLKDAQDEREYLESIDWDYSNMW